MDGIESTQRLAHVFDFYGTRYAQHLAQTIRERVALAGDVYVFGAGQNGRIVAASLHAAGHAPAAFIDDTPAKIGTTIDGVPVIASESIRGKRSAFVVVSVYLAHHDYLTIAQRLRALGAGTASLLQFFWGFAFEQLPFYFHALPDTVMRARGDIEWLATRLVDRASFDELCAHVEFRLSLRHEILPAWTPQRLPAPAHWRGIGFVDAGAFDGDTVIPFVKSHGERTAFALALEPDPANHAKLLENLAELPPHVRALIEPVDYAIDAVSGSAAFTENANAGSSLSAHGTTLVRTVSLDDLLSEREAERIYVKMDVEGAEANLIRGAQKTIRERAPFLAVSVYHRPADLWELPRQIAQLDPGYRFMLRSHGADGADLTAYAIRPGA